MDTVTPVKRSSTWKRVFFIVLIFLPIVLFLEATLGTMLGTKGTEFFAYRQLLEQRGQVAGLTTNLLIDYLLGPGHQLWRFQSSGMAADQIMILAKEYPEIFGVYLVGKNGKTTPLLQGYPSAEIQEKVINIIPSVIDSATFATAYWDTTWKRDLQWREVTQRLYFFGSFQTDAGTYVVVMDVEKLKSQLPAIFDQWQKRLAVFLHYFLPSPEFAAQVKFSESDGSVFYVLGEPKGKSWAEIYDQNLKFLPWKITVTIFPRDSKLVTLASMVEKWPWGPAVPFIIGMICILALAWTARKSWWF